MTVGAEYELVYKDPFGARLFTFTPDMFETMDLVRKENNVGILELTIPEVMSTSYLNVDCILEVYRTVGGKKYLEGDTFWYLRKWDFDQKNDGTDFSSLVFYDTNDLLRRRIVNYNAGSAYSDKTDYIDDMMKAIVRENMGALATDATRDISAYLTVSADRSEAPSVSKGFAWRNVMDVLKELAEHSYNEGTYLAFDTVKSSAGVSEFRTYINQRGTDHGSSSAQKITFKDEFGNLTDSSLRYDYTDMANVIIAGGPGQEDARVTATATSTSIYQSPVAMVEEFINASGTENLLSYVQAEADTKLAERRPRVKFGGKAVDTPNFRYGIDYYFGDLVVAEKDSVALDVHIDTVHISFKNGKEELDIQLNGEISI